MTRREMSVPHARENQSPLPFGQGKVCFSIGNLKRSTSFPRGLWKPIKAVDLALQHSAELQLRDSTGLHSMSVTGIAFKPSHPGVEVP
jgi:hypothetical protein